MPSTGGMNANVKNRQLRDTISLRNSEINKMQTEMASGHTKAIFTLSKMSSQEAHVVKTLTGLALIFVPASFVAVNLPHHIFKQKDSNTNARTSFRWAMLHQQEMEQRGGWRSLVLRYTPYWPFP